MVRAASVSSAGRLLVPLIFTKSTLRSWTETCNEWKIVTRTNSKNKNFPCNLMLRNKVVVFVGVAALAVAAPATASTPGYVGFVCVRALRRCLARSRPRAGRGRRLMCLCSSPRRPMPARRRMHAAPGSRTLHRRPPPVCFSQIAPGVVPDSLGAVSASGNSLLRRCSIGAAQRFTPLASNMAGGQPLHRRVTPFLSARAGVPRSAHHGLARPTHFPKFYSLRSG